MFTDEMIRTIPTAELTRMRLQEGWDYADPVNGKNWRDLMPDNPYAYQAQGHDPRNELQSNFIAGTQGQQGNPDLAEVEADPKMQEIAKQTGASVQDLLLYREMMLDRYGSHYDEEQDDTAPHPTATAHDKDLPKPKSVAKAKALQSGTHFIDPKGKRRKVP